ncbi:gas vesicle protein [Streptomyces sp. PKU-EA00015]|nr:gas vesicle protein [Streptomyces sp. PKU-EA00015]
MMKLYVSVRRMASAPSVGEIMAPEQPAEGRSPGVVHAMRAAAQQLQELLGRTPESVSAIQPTSDGWEARVEVLELERIPETTSVMASYRVTLDEEGNLLGYEKTRRYTRGHIDRDG